MKNFLAIYTGAPMMRQIWEALPEAERKQREKDGMAAWQAWMVSNKASLVDNGGPLGKTKHVSKPGIADIRNNMGCLLHRARRVARGSSEDVPESSALHDLPGRSRGDHGVPADSRAVSPR